MQYGGERVKLHVPIDLFGNAARWTRRGAILIIRDTGASKSSDAFSGSFSLTDAYRRSSLALSLSVLFWYRLRRPPRFVILLAAYNLGCSLSILDTLTCRRPDRIVFSFCLNRLVNAIARLYRLRITSACLKRALIAPGNTIEKINRSVLFKNSHVFSGPRCAFIY